MVSGDYNIIIKQTVATDDGRESLSGDLNLTPGDMRMGDGLKRMYVYIVKSGRTQKEERLKKGVGGNQLKCAKFTDLELLSICCAKEPSHS